MNFFATEVYGATFLLVALSWAGFWVDPRRYGDSSVAAIRLGLGLLIVLILIVYGVAFRLLHNKVNHNIYTSKLLIMYMIATIVTEFVMCVS